MIHQIGLLLIVFFMDSAEARSLEIAKLDIEQLEEQSSSLSEEDANFVDKKMRQKLRGCGEQEHREGEKYYYVKFGVETFYMKGAILRAKLISGVNRSYTPCEGVISVITLREWEELSCPKIKDQVISFCEWELDNDPLKNTRFFDPKPTSTDKPRPPEIEL